MTSAIKIIIMVLAIFLLDSPGFAQTTTTDSTPAVTTDATNSPADLKIIKSIQNNIAKDSILKQYNITTMSLDGDVTLDGTVNSQAQATAAINAAKTVDGVKSVKSNIIVKTASP